MHGPDFWISAILLTLIWNVLLLYCLKKEYLIQNPLARSHAFFFFSERELTLSYMINFCSSLMAVKQNVVKALIVLLQNCITPFCQVMIS